MRFQYVVFLNSRASFYTTFLNNCAEVKASGLPHVHKLWLVGKQEDIYISIANPATPTNPIFCFVCNVYMKVI